MLEAYLCTTYMLRYVWAYQNRLEKSLNRLGQVRTGQDRLEQGWTRLIQLEWTMTGYDWNGQEVLGMIWVGLERLKLARNC